MKSFSVKAKIIMLVCICVVGVFGLVAIFNGRQQTNTLEGLYTSSSHELSWALSKQLEECMIYGDNEKLQPMTEEIVSTGLLLEATVINAEKVVRRSSDKSLLNKPSDAVWSSLFASKRDTLFDTSEKGKPVQVAYHLLTNQTACASCHDGAAGSVLGGLKMVRSTEVLAEATRANLFLILMCSIAGVLVLVVAIMLALNKLVFRPIQIVKARLYMAAQGEIGQDLSARSNDEIGQLLMAIQSLMEYIRGLCNVASRAASGDLSAEVVPRSERDVLGTAFHTMIQYLRNMIHELSDHSRQLASAATEIASASDEMSRGTKEQSQQITQISSAVEGMVNTIVESTKNAGDARDLAQNAAGTAASGGRIVGDTIQGMQRIADVVRESAVLVGRLSQAAEQIGEIVQVIDDIADQTNMLALNAAIEAARAGEQGRGFAVVADEVRKLAERTGKATGEVNQMIRDIQTRTSEAVESMETGISEVGQGRELADRAGGSLDEICTLAQQVETVISQIAGTSEQQSEVAQQIAANVEQIASVTKETASGAEQSAAAAEQLSRQAEGLRQIVGRFKIEAQ